MAKFITNDATKDLKTRLIELIKNSKSLKFLVGFFYFSGIRELYDGLKENPDTELKVLVGLSIDKANYGLIEYSDNDRLSDDERAFRFFESVKKSLNSEDFDTQEFYEQVKFFLEMIINNKLIIRKTVEPNHSKLYIFKLNDNQVGRKELFITGSSNLTKAGLSTQNEFNVEIGDYGTEEAEKYFDDLWADAVKITEYEDDKKRLIEIIEKETLVKEVTPFEAFCVVLKTYLDTFNQKEIGESLTDTLQRNNYKPYRYQMDAVRQALSIIENNNGVIVADVVGLGKSIIACAIAKQMKKRGIIICPPGLKGDANRKSGWMKYTEEFRLDDWEVRSLGDLENTLEYVNRTNDFEVVIVDEAHRFRNQDTRDYELLKNICRNRQVILLTATPFNNHPGDILSLLKLFIAPKKATISLEGNLVVKFKGFERVFNDLAYIKKHYNSDDPAKRNSAISKYMKLFGSNEINLINVKKRAHHLAKQIRDIVEPIIIRRNRLDLQNNPYYKSEVTELSKVADPKEWFYELNKEQSDFYNEILEEYFGDPDDGGRFKGAIYRPFEYERAYKQADNSENEDNRQFQQQRNLFDFMRRLLVKRFESSFGSFEQSIKNFLRIATICKDFIEKTNQYILDRSLLERIYEEDPDEIEKYLMDYEEKLTLGEYPKNYKVYKINDFKRKKEFLQDIQSDIDLFKEVQQRLKKLDMVKNDPKTNCLIENIKAEFAKKTNGNEPKRKIIIFTEYLDTVNYLRKAMEKVFAGKMLVVAGDLTPQKVKQINENFDASYKPQHDNFDILLTSDKISEGFNLNRAGMVINYDIPWNPVRVIQRLGRINRISKKVFNELFIVNFFPTEKGALLVQSREIAGNKMFLIHNALGEDSKIFDIDEEPSASGLFNRIQQNPDEDEQESFYTKAFKLFFDIKEKYPELIESISKYPTRIKTAKEFIENELLVFFRKGRLYVTCFNNDQPKSEPYYSSFEEIFDKIKCEEDEKALDWNTSEFWDAYKKVKDFRESSPDASNERGLENKALNNIDFLVRSAEDKVIPYKEFLRVLKSDIIEYGTLPDYTLRRIMNLKETNVKELQELKSELGSEYLSKETDRIIKQKKELIIAIENKKQ